MSDLDETDSAPTPLLERRNHDSSSEELRQLKGMGTDLTTLVSELQQMSETIAADENPARKRAMKRVREDHSLQRDLAARLRRIR